MTDTTVFDKKNFANRLANNEQLMSMVVTEFLKELGQLMPELAQSVTAGNWQMTKSLAHRIKGASAEVSANAVCEDARKIEDAVKSGNVASIADGFASLEENYKLLKKALSDIFPS